MTSEHFLFKKLLKIKKTTTVFASVKLDLRQHKEKQLDNSTHCENIK